MSKVRVVIVDDSPTMRAVIRTVLNTDPGIKVVGEAGDAYEARDLIKALNPDVLTLDIEMPRMSGLDFLEKIMTLRPMPVIMLSSLTKRGAVDTFRALSLGAFDCVAKPTSGDYIAAVSHLPSLIHAASQYKPKSKSNAAEPMAAPSVISDYRPNSSVVAIGASTGGVEALMNVLKRYPANCPPTVITQHMPESFLATFAQRLDRTIAPVVSIAKDGSPLLSGQVYLAPGGENHLELVGKMNFTCRLLAGPKVTGHRPSVDVLFNSVARSAGPRGVGVILTGMGKDGAQGLAAMRQAGARTIGQDAASCVVYGMPRIAHELGGVQQQLSLSQIGERVISLCSAKRAVA